MGNVNRRIAVHAGPRINMRPVSKIIKAQRRQEMEVWLKQ
jgi:hypothetical protein